MKMNKEIKPIRIQRSRQHKMVNPNGLPIVYVGRPSKWGNPFEIGRITRENAVILYKEGIIKGFRIIEVKQELKGKNLSCWCSLDKPCHADILLKIANEV